MANYDTSNWDPFIRNLYQAGNDMQRLQKVFMEHIVRVYLNRVKKKTPVRAPPLGGNLRRSWKSDGVKSFGSDVYADVLNSADYAEFVEFGFTHWISKEYIKGQYFMTLTNEEISEYMDKRAEQVLNKYLRTLGK